MKALKSIVKKVLNESEDEPSFERIKDDYERRLAVLTHYAEKLLNKQYLSPEEMDNARHILFELYQDKKRIPSEIHDIINDKLLDVGLIDNRTSYLLKTAN